jgi:hypothetical protein
MSTRKYKGEIDGKPVKVIVIARAFMFIYFNFQFDN